MRHFGHNVSLLTAKTALHGKLMVSWYTVIVCTLILFPTFCSLIISAGPRDWKPGSHRVRAWKRCPETPRDAARLRERLAKKKKKSWHRNLLCLLVLLRFTSCLVSTVRAFEYVTRFYLSLFFQRMPTCATLLQPPLWHPVPHIDLHTTDAHCS